jgi:hypothetical protein
MTTEIPEDVLTALKGIVQWTRTFDPDDDKLLANDIPTIANWLEQLGLLSPDEYYEPFPEE